MTIIQAKGKTQILTKQLLAAAAALLLHHYLLPSAAYTLAVYICHALLTKHALNSLADPHRYVLMHSYLNRCILTLASYISPLPKQGLQFTKPRGKASLLSVISLWRSSHLVVLDVLLTCLDPDRKSSTLQGQLCVLA